MALALDLKMPFHAHMGKWSRDRDPPQNSAGINEDMKLIRSGSVWTGRAGGGGGGLWGGFAVEAGRVGS